MLTKEEMALEALIKIVAEISWDEQSISEQTLSYAKDALAKNGWEAFENLWGVKMCRKINAQTPNTTSN